MTIGSSKGIRKQSDGVIYCQENSSKTGKNEWGLQEEAESHLQTERKTSGGTGEGTGDKLGSNEANKEEKERAKEEAETKNRRISMSD